MQQGDNSFDLTGYLNEGENTITATFLDSYGTSRSMNWQVNAVNIVIESEFDDTITYDGAATISYVAKGSVEKTVHFELDGEEVYSVELSGDQVLQIPTEPTYDGYFFLGWFKDQECTEKYNFDEIVSPGMTLFGGWEKSNAIKINSFVYLNGGFVIISPLNFLLLSKKFNVSSG